MSPKNLSDSSPQVVGLDISKVSVIGLGRLGAPFALACASRGFDVTGVDVNPHRVKELSEGKFPWWEPKAQKYLEAFRERLHFSTKHEDAIERSDISVILTSTPSESDGRFSSRFVCRALHALAAAQAKLRKPLHAYIISSTLFPSAFRADVLPLLEPLRDAGLDFRACYCPEFVALGKVIDDFLMPDFVVIGEPDEESGDVAETFYRRLTTNPNLRVIRTNTINAELAKISLNVFLTVKISFANLVAEICERFKGADVDVVSYVLGKDSRISPHFLKGGAAFGGTCFPRDVKVFQYLTKSFAPSLGWSIERINARQVWRLAEQIMLLEKREVCILGTSFKPGTSETAESPSHKLIELLLPRGYKIVVHDPHALEQTRARFGNAIEYKDNPIECLSTPVVVVMVPHKEYLRLYKHFKKDQFVFDIWRIYKDKPLECKYWGIGLG